MNTHEVIHSGSGHLQSLTGYVFDVLTVSKPSTTAQAVNLAKVISKLSPLVANLIEFNTVDFLNEKPQYRAFGKWMRQDPGFPDTIFDGSVSPTPGFEIKAWFPLATEITARFKDSQQHVAQDQTYVCMLAWLPDKLLFGKPRIVDVCIVSGRSVAEARDNHYHNPPDYLVVEPEDTTARTRNLQQTNTNGYKFQGTTKQLEEAQRVVEGWGLAYSDYQTTVAYQGLLRDRELVASLHPTRCHRPEASASLDRASRVTESPRNQRPEVYVGSNVVRAGYDRRMATHSLIRKFRQTLSHLHVDELSAVYVSIDVEGEHGRTSVLLKSH